MPKQLVKSKGQCILQGRSITWISIKTPRNIQGNSVFEINLDRQLTKGLIPLDVLHNIEHKQPEEMLIPLLNVMNSVVKLPKNTILGSITKVNSAENVQHMYSPKHPHVEAKIKTQPSDPLLPAFPNHSSFTTHAHNSNKSPIQLQDANVLLDIQQKFS